jgi:putative restriction endonuclease
MSHSQKRSWLLLTFGDKRQYAGNSGYDDDPHNVYHYDSTVPNHKRISEGDIAVIRGVDKLLGVAKIERISSYAGQKIRLRCPVCNSVHLKKRKRVQPPFRCEKKHVFETPSEEVIECTNFKAFFGSSFISTPGIVAVADLRKACPHYSEQFAMQMIDIHMIADALLAATPTVGPLIETVFGVEHYLAPNEAEEPGEGQGILDGSNYMPTHEDGRDSITRTIRARRGQQAFRHSLIARYGPMCMVTGCNLLDIVEAAHISPYRGRNDQHEENGLLLRADIHVLFDLQLMGIEPDTLTIKFHPYALSSGYQEYEGKRLSCRVGPSVEALKSRWVLFNKRLDAEKR